MSTTVESDFVLTEEFERALAILESGDNLFLTGKAGTGKSTLIRHFLEDTSSEDSGDRRVLVAAPTGIAALNVGGYTIHRLFSLLATTTLDDVRHGGYKPQRFAKALRSLQTLIIDEASMVRADLFDMLVAALERFGPRPGTRFGGVQIVLVGDLLQLPPVVTTGESEYFSTRYDTPYFFSADSFRREDFPTVALTTVFRQLGDQRLTSILNAVREGVLLESAQHDLNACTDPDFVPPDDEFWLTLAPTNAIVTARNRQRLERLDGQEFTHFAERLGDLSLFDAAADDKLTFKVGAQVMMLSNDQSERWVNGTLGRIIAVTHRETGLVATIEFRDGAVADVGAHTWEATRPVVDGGALRHEVIGSYTQLPFKLAWAITIHKSQGQTLDRLVVDLSGGAFDFGQVYVALSRCTSMDGLVLTRPVRPKDLRTDRRILRFLRDGGSSDEVRRHCAIGMLTVGDEGRLSRPRPVEIAVAFDDGTSISTLINPQRDLAGARDAYGITVDDVLLAPTLAEAWTVLGPLLEGATPVGVSTDHALGLIDFEFKRLGRIMPLPMGIDLHVPNLRSDERQGMLAGSARERAQTALAAHTRLEVRDGGASAFAAYDDADAGSAYLLTRDPGVAPPSSVHLPVLSALLDISREISAVLLEGMSAHEVRTSIRPVADDSHDAGLRTLAAERLKIVASRSTGVPAALIDRFGEVGILLGIETTGLLDLLASPTSAIAEVLVPGARVCFTGEARSPSGRMLDREDMDLLAADCGLIPVKTVTKTKCEALVVAEVGTQSGKARKAVDYGKPVFSAEEFFTWVTTTGPSKMSAVLGL